MVKEITSITPISTSHNIGLKKVLLSCQESESSITQIAITQLRKGEVIEEHSHNTMEEHYIFQYGNVEMIIDGKTFLCHEKTYVYVPAGVKHGIKVLTDTELITIGVAI